MFNDLINYKICLSIQLCAFYNCALALVSTEYLCSRISEMLLLYIRLHVQCWIVALSQVILLIHQLITSKFYL